MASKRKIIGVRCDSNPHIAIIESWTAFFSNGEQETYAGEIPPKAVSMFCCKAKYGFKSIDCDCEHSVDLWYQKPEMKDKMLEEKTKEEENTMDNQIKMMLEAEIASINEQIQPMSEGLTRLAGLIGKKTDFWLLNGQLKKLEGKLEGINIVLKALGYTRMLDASGKWVIVDTKTYLHAIGWDQLGGDDHA